MRALLLAIVLAAPAAAEVSRSTVPLDHFGTPPPCAVLEDCPVYSDGGYSYSPDGCNTCTCDPGGICSCTLMGCYRDWRGTTETGMAVVPRDDEVIESSSAVIIMDSTISFISGNPFIASSRTFSTEVITIKDAGCVGIASSEDCFSPPNHPLTVIGGSSKHQAPLVMISPGASVSHLTINIYQRDGNRGTTPVAHNRVRMPDSECEWLPFHLSTIHEEWKGRIRASEIGFCPGARMKWRDALRRRP